MCALSLEIRSIINYSNSAMRLEVGKKRWNLSFNFIHAMILGLLVLHGLLVLGNRVIQFRSEW